MVVDKEKEYDSNLAEARKGLAMIRYEIFSEKYCPSPIIKKKETKVVDATYKNGVLSVRIIKKHS